MVAPAHRPLIEINTSGALTAELIREKLGACSSATLLVRPADAVSNGGGYLFAIEIARGDTWLYGLCHLTRGTRAALLNETDFVRFLNHSTGRAYYEEMVPRAQEIQKALDRLDKTRMNRGPGSSEGDQQP